MPKNVTFTGNYTITSGDANQIQVRVNTNAWQKLCDISGNTGTFTGNLTLALGTYKFDLRFSNGSKNSPILGNIKNVQIIEKPIVVPPDPDPVYPVAAPVPLADWETLLQRMLSGSMAYASTGKARMTLPPTGNFNSDTKSRQMEPVTRSFCAASWWIKGTGKTSYTFNSQTVDVVAFYKQALLNGTNTAHSEYWGDPPTNGQELVEIHSIAMGVWLTKAQIWDTLTTTEKTQVANYLRKTNSASFRQGTNWSIFNLLANTVLKKLGETYDQNNYNKYLTYVNDHNYSGDGWYRDYAVANPVDFYSFFTFHSLMLFWCWLDGDSNLTVKNSIIARAKRLAQDFPYFFSVKGNMPFWGRSTIYRMAFLGCIPMLKVLGEDPGISNGILKSILSSTFRYFFGDDYGITKNSVKLVNDNSIFTMGYTFENPVIVESYSCPGSTWWSLSQSGAFFLLDPTFWNATEEKLPIFNQSYEIALPNCGASYIGNKKTGIVQMLNGKYLTKDTGNYAAKYTKYVYNTMFGHNIGLINNDISIENTLTFKIGSNPNFARQYADSIYVDKGISSSHFMIPGTNSYCESYYIHHNGGILTVNRITISPNDNFTVTEGGYALGYKTGEIPSLESSNIDSEIVRNGDKYSYIQKLYGWANKIAATNPYTNPKDNGNIYDPLTMIPGVSKVLTGSPTIQYQFLVTYVHAGNDNLSTAKLLTAIKSCTVNNDLVTVVFEDDTTVLAQIEKTPTVNLTVNSQSITGRLAIAKVHPSDASKTVIIRPKFDLVAWNTFNGTANALVTSRPSEIGVITRHPESHPSFDAIFLGDGTARVVSPVVIANNRSIYRLTDTKILDGRICAKINYKNLITPMSIGIGLNLDDTIQNLYYMDLFCDNTTSKLLSRCSRINAGIFDTKDAEELPMMEGEIAYIELRKKAGLIEYLVNGTLWYSYTDPTPLPSGYPCLRFYAADQVVQNASNGIVIDDVKAYNYL